MPKAVSCASASRASDSASENAPRSRMISARWIRQIPGKPETDSRSHQRVAASVHSLARR